MIRDLHRRLGRIEGHAHQGAPTRILADRWMEDEEGAACLATWRKMVAAGRASMLVAS